MSTFERRTRLQSRSDVFWQDVRSERTGKGSTGDQIHRAFTGRDAGLAMGMGRWAMADGQMTQTPNAKPKALNGTLLTWRGAEVSGVGGIAGHVIEHGVEHRDERGGFGQARKHRAIADTALQKKRRTLRHLEGVKLRGG